MVKKLKRLIFSRNPVGQEEKQGKARFPLAVPVPVPVPVLFDCRAIDEHPPLRYGESSYKGDEEKSERGTKKEPIPQTKNTSKRHNRLHKINIFCFVIWKQIVIFATLKNFIWKQNQDSRSNYPTKPKSF